MGWLQSGSAVSSDLLKPASNLLSCGPTSVLVELLTKPTPQFMDPVVLGELALLCPALHSRLL